MHCVVRSKTSPVVCFPGSLHRQPAPARCIIIRAESCEPCRWYHLGSTTTTTRGAFQVLLVHGNYRVHARPSSSGAHRTMTPRGHLRCERRLAARRAKVTRPIMPDACACLHNRSFSCWLYLRRRARAFKPPLICLPPALVLLLGNHEAAPRKQHPRALRSAF
jgi:hypothetical protein